MADFGNQRARVDTTTQSVEVDQGLRAYMLKVYNLMGLGVALSGIAAMGTATYAASNPAFQQLLYASPLKYVVMFAPLAFVMIMSFGINKLSTGAAQGLFWAFAAIMGVSISSIFLVFTQSSIASTFFITAASFGALSLYGYTTKRDLSGMGSFLFMGLIGLILAMVVNLFLASGPLAFAINVIGVLIFAGLTAYDTQRIKSNYMHMAGNTAVMAKSAVYDALSLYLNFVNMFMFLLQFLGNRE